MAESTKALLFLHGIGNDDAGRTWLTTLNLALRRDGVETVEERGFQVCAPSYLHLLEDEPPSETAATPYTYRRPPTAEEERAAAGRYWLGLSRLERSLSAVPRPAPGPLASIPSSVAPLLVSRVAAQADSYRRSEERRKAILAKIVDELPPDGDLVIIAHSLGSVVAADLLYFLPRRIRTLLLLTIGSPLSMPFLRRHLNRLHDDFPFGTVDAWLNVVGHHDPVTGSRGVSPVFPEALDMFVDNGASPETVHSTARYLDQEVVVRALDWVDHGAHVVTSTMALPDKPLDEAMLAVATGAQYALRLEQAMVPGTRRTRFGSARALVAEQVEADLAVAGLEHPVVHRLLRDNAAVLSGRLEAESALPLLLTAWVGNPIRPYEIDFDDDVRRTALANLCTDLGLPTNWALVVEKTVKRARDAHGRFDWKRVVVVTVGVAVVAAAPALVILAAPAGLAGGAAFVGG